MHRKQYRAIFALSDRLLTISEVREHLHCSRSTVYKFFKLGYITPIKLGTGTRVRLSELRTFVLSLASNGEGK